MLQIPSVQAETLNVHLLLSEGTAPYQQFSEAFKNALAGSDVSIIVSQVGESLPRSRKFDLVVAAGMKATESALSDYEVPLLSMMITRANFEMLRERLFAQSAHRAPMSAIYLDQSWDRQFNFIKAALPAHSVVGMLYSPEAHITLPRLPRGMSINAQSVRSSELLFSTLENILNNSEVLLVIPDSEIYSANNMRNILLTSYRYKIPMVGISQAYVNAGALCAIFSTPEQFGLQAAQALSVYAKDRQLPDPQYSELYSIAVNQQVAHSMGIIIDTPEEIRLRMSKELKR